MMTPDLAPDADTVRALDVVAAARARLGELDPASVAGHVAVLDEVHDVLQSTLAGLDER